MQNLVRRDHFKHIHAHKHTHTHTHTQAPTHTSILTVQSLIYTQLKTGSKQRLNWDRWRQRHGGENMDTVWVTCGLARASWSHPSCWRWVWLFWSWETAFSWSVTGGWDHWDRLWVRLFWSWKTAFGWSVTSGWNHRDNAAETDYEWDYFDPESLLSVDQSQAAETIVMTPWRPTMSETILFLKACFRLIRHGLLGPSWWRHWGWLWVNGPLRDSVSSRLLVIARWETCWSPRDLVSGRHPVEETEHLDLWHARHRFLWCEQ